ncbi:hypothetical protein BDB00DRAFT_859360 [Zychaea mexicana]|uniref:uncharacterized protein n=1 Tax=Zychaea mexicana TaxID=64656 RepID=UPI0022FE9905|nr:uncharacterized protein BDB00DRAFT_859360 [Zychaea mexicana]KAI9477141.1 hypothetical protein BDB00DRAFT_859360 [Zychaea mexicana]
MASSEDYLTLPREFLPRPRHQPTESVKSGRTIVIAYDQTRASDALLDKTIRTGLLQPDDDIRLVHILPQQDFFSSLTQQTSNGNSVMASMPSFDAQTTSQAKDQNEKIQIEAKEDMLLAVAKVLQKNSFQHVKVEVVQGDPKQSLQDYCQSVKPTFLMTGSRGFGKFKSSILGSVSDHLAKNCPCPVMIIKVTEEEIEARTALAETKKSIFSNWLCECIILFSPLTPRFT